MKIDFARNSYGDEEKSAVERVLASGWLASGEENTKFEKEFAEYIGRKYAVCVNSGSSANLLALSALRQKMSPRPKVLTSACGFPATLSPILHLGCTPVLVDYDIKTLNADVNQVIKEIPNVEAIILAHTLGNPLEIDLIKRVADAHHVFIIEDCCEAIGTTLNGEQVGSFGDIGTFSFYPSHQMTAGGMGGMLVTDDREIANTLKELRDWGKKWNWDEVLGDNVTMYDQVILGKKYYRHYTYSQIGYNFKLAEMNAAFGREQLKKMETFKFKRRENFNRLYNGINWKEDFFEYITLGNPCWFAFPMVCKDSLDRNAFGDYLESVGIRHRPFFAGNILNHPPFAYLKKNVFSVADRLMEKGLFIGCHPEMGDKECDYVIEKVNEYVNRRYS